MNPDRNPDRNNDRNTDRNSDRNPDRSQDQTQDRNQDRIPNRNNDRTPDRVPDRNTTSDQDNQRQGEKSLTIRAIDAWTDTSIRVQRGMRLTFNSRGDIQVARNRSADPDGAAGDLGSVFNRFPMPDVAAGALIGKIILDDGSETQPFFVGKIKEYTVSRFRTAIFGYK